ncbi:MAG: hypothetical protein ABIK97_07985 [candidate division WOR-3 bacterium]
MRDALRRIEKYISKLEPEIIRRDFAQLKEKMLQQITTYFIEIFEVETKAKAILSEYDLPVSLIPFYLCYARELYSLSKRYAGFPLFREIRIREGKWRSRTLQPEILRRIRFDIFGITLPEEI